MDLRTVEVFLTLAEEASFTRTAERLHTVQSNVSATIRRLENEVGVLLFDRTTKRVALTAAGDAFLPAAKDLITAYRRAVEAALDLAPEVRGRLRIGTMTNFQSDQLPRLLAEYSRAHPLVDIRLVVSDRGSRGLAEGLRQGNLDVAFLSLPDAQRAGLITVELSRSPMTLIVPADWTPPRTPLGLADLAGERFVESPDGFGNRMHADALFTGVGVDRKIAFELSDLSLVPRFVAQGLGIALVPGAILGSADRKMPWVGQDEDPGLALLLAMTPLSARTRAVTVFQELLRRNPALAEWNFSSTRA